jgi:PST family polysaccharide transporter
VVLAEVVRDFGLASAAVQARTLSEEQRSNLFWANTAIGSVLTAAFLAAAPAVASVFSEPRLVGLCQLLALTFLLNGMSAQYVADLARNLRFRASVLVNVGSQVAGLGCGVVAAVMGAEHLALGLVSVSSSGAALVLARACCDWWPGVPRRGVPMRGFFRFGGGMLGAQLLGAASYQAHSVVLGTTLGAAQLGSYSRAYQLIHLPLNQLQAPATRVALPVLSRVQDEPMRFLAAIRRGQTALLHVPAMVVLAPAAVAPVLLPLLLGEQWSGISTPFRILAAAGVANMGAYVCYWVYLAKGLTGSYFRFSLWARPCVILAVVLGGSGGVVGVAAAFSLTSMVLWPLNYWWLARTVSLPVWGLFRNAVRVVSVHTTVAVTAGLVLAVVEGPDWMRLGVGILALLVGYALVVTASRSVRVDLAALWELAGARRRRRAGAPRPGDSSDRPQDEPRQDLVTPCS